MTPRFRYPMLIALIVGLSHHPVRLSAACCPGDIDGNGIVQSADTFQFAGILLGVAGTPDQLCASDVNADGARNGRDIQAFVARVIAGDVCPAACCMGDGVCQTLTPNQCAVLGGCTQGIGTICAPNPCACQAGRCDVNGLCADGCELLVNSSPQCATVQFLGNVSGDEGADVININGTTEAWYRVQLSEDSSSTVYLSAAVNLQSNPQSNFDLFVSCFQCGQPVVINSTLGTGLMDQVFMRWDDDFGQDDTASIIIEVRWNSGGCDGFHLNITGNVAAVTQLCNP